MQTSYGWALKAVLTHEGGYSNNPADPGGATMRGVTQAVYDAYRRRLGLGVRSVKFLADDELQAIYRKQYWDAVKSDELPSGLDYCVFDFAVNSGPLRAARYLQTAVGTQPDGVIGLVTLHAAENADPKVVIHAICDKRLEFLQGLPDWHTFGKGWAARVSGVRALALAMTGGTPVVKTADAPPVVPVVASEPSFWGWLRGWLGK
jgi:lysozyme family protein